MEENKKLVLSFLQHLNDEQRSSHLSNDDIESLDVAIQCLESVYKTSIRDVEAIGKFQLPASMPEIFQAGLEALKNKAPVTVDKVKAEQLKVEGNEHMFKEAFKEAIEAYTQAIHHDPNNAIYFCNRAAAYSKIGDLQQSISDCQKATHIDPLYAKAYGRKGLAHTALNQHEEARACYLKASQLDPANTSYQDNLRMAEASLRNAQPAGGMGAGMGGLGGFDFNLSSMLNNPVLVSMASSMLSNPQIQTMMSNLMTNMNQTDETPGVDRLIQVGQQFAQQMQESNPALIEQLRSHAATTTTSSHEATTNNNASAPPSDQKTTPTEEKKDESK